MTAHSFRLLSIRFQADSPIVLLLLLLLLSLLCMGCASLLVHRFWFPLVVLLVLSPIFLVLPFLREVPVQVVSSGKTQCPNLGLGSISSYIQLVVLKFLHILPGCLCASNNCLCWCFIHIVGIFGLLPL